MKSKTIPAMLLATSMVSGVVPATPTNNATDSNVRFNYEQVENVNIFYREAGSKNAPTILMLHGYAASSFMWRDVIDALSDDYHVTALDLPAFGFTESPAREDYEYTLIPKAEIHFFDTGHFALETHQSEIIPVIKDFLQRNLK